MTVVDDIVTSSLAFGVPGGGASLDIIDALERAGGRFHTTRFEGAAALMAGAAGRLNGKPGVALGIKGPGLANMVAGLATAMLEDLPVLAVCEAFGRADGAQRAHKRIDHDALTVAIIKARCGIEEKNAVQRLSQVAMAERPGPVLLELADVPARWPHLQPCASRDAAGVLRAIETAERPVVIAGSFAQRLGLSAALKKLRIPIFSTAGTKGVVDETLPHAAGVYTGAGLSLAPERQLLAAADLVVGIGLRTHEVLVAGVPLPAVNIDDLDASPGFEFVGLAPSGDAGHIVAALAAKRDWAGDLLGQAKETMRGELLDGPFLPAQVFSILAERMSHVRMVLDTGFFCTIAEHIWTVRSPEFYLSSGQGRSMGAALPIALGAVAARPQQPAVLAIGDGGIGMFVGELQLAAAERFPLLVLLMRDGTYASIRDRAVGKGLSERSLVPPDTDWASVAEVMGFAAGRAETADGVDRFIERWNGKGPALLDIRFAPEPYRVMTEKLRG